MFTKPTKNQGMLLVLVLVFGAIFFSIVVSFMGFVVTQSQIQQRKLNEEKALNIAEAGLDYYKWFLAHNPDDTTNGTGLPGPYEIPIMDPELGVIGTSSLAVSSSTYCGVVSNIDIYSTGYTVDNPAQTRTIYGRYARPTVAEYAYIINSNVWAGADRTIVGPYHSNGIIHMDGTNNSTVTSGQEDWVCDGTIGCSPKWSTKDAVFGNGPNYSLWNFPAPTINFTGITVNLASMKERAQNGGGIYIPTSNKYGYRVDFQSDNTIDVYKVTNTYNYRGSSNGSDWVYERNIISNDNFYATYTINNDCPLIYVEDKVWLEGDVATKVTIAAANSDSLGDKYSMIVNDNINYTSSSSGLLAAAQEDVLVGVVVPNNMTINGIFIAQNGRFGRNHYSSGYLPNPSGSLNFQPYYERNSLTINGTIVSNGGVGTQWAAGNTFYSGFHTRYSSYDRDLVDNPPPLAPHTSDDYRFVDWREVD